MFEHRKGRGDRGFESSCNLWLLPLDLKDGSPSGCRKLKEGSSHETFAGLDLPMESTQVCIVDEMGGKVASMKVESDPGMIARSLREAGGWAKLNRITGHLNEENAEHLLALAESHTYYQLDLILKGEEPVERAKVMLLYLSETDYARLSQLLMNTVRNLLPWR